MSNITLVSPMTPFELLASINHGAAVVASLPRTGRGFRYPDAIKALDASAGRDAAISRALQWANDPRLTHRDAEIWIASLYRKSH